MFVFTKFPPQWELFWMDLDHRYTRFAEIIWLLAHADRNTVHSFVVWCGRGAKGSKEILKGANGNFEKPLLQLPAS